ncbi:type VII secretion integral membrane protein EccD [Actinomadura syzygii]|uniref:Type VII secretion integral membrane protein EccD n=2 Tax=Actinomadura syzygii TaxID=1427538 RepID=A0A5D0U0S7_9ACTN|nr:type VII secretion integral membrane protein EccD [Actinomadura syzygii]
MANMTSETCRVTVVAPTGWIEVAVPSDVPVADLLPVLVQQAGDHAAEEGLEHSGWVLQRLGEEPLDEDRTPAALGLLDGDTLYLRPRDAGLPALEFDDVVDGVSAGVRSRPARWRESTTRWMFLGLVAVTLATALAVLLSAPIPAAERAAAAALIEITLLAAAAGMSRAFADTAAGVLLGAAALPDAALAGALAVRLAEPAGSGGLGAPHLAAASASVAGAAFLAMLGTGAAGPLFLAAGGLGVAGTAGGILEIATRLDAPRSAAVVATVALTLAPVVPVTAFRLARMRLPILPRTPEELQQDLEPVASSTLLDRAAVADHYMIALSAAIGTVAAACMTLLPRQDGWEAAAMLPAICAALMLRSRVMSGAWTRLAVILPACFGLALYVVRWVGDRPAAAGAVLPLLVALTGLFLVGAERMPGKRLLPYWGRAADLAESAVSIALPLLMLAVLHGYGWARAFGD